MKAWQLKGVWLHKESNKQYTLTYLVLTEDNQDPVEVFHATNDYSGMTYLRGVVTELNPPFSLHLA